MAQSRLAVLIPNYNDAHFLPRVLTSVFSQSKIPDEVWVSDDASTDNSLEVLAEFATRHPQLKVLRNTQNAGIPENSFKPFYATRCDYIYTLGCDEYLVDPNIFQKAASALDDNPQVGLVCWDCANVYPDGQIFSERLQDHPGALTPDEVVESLARRPFPILTRNSIMRREACLQKGVLCSEAAWNSDWFCGLTIAFRHGIYYLPGVYNHFPVRAEGLAESSRSRIREPIRQMLEVLNREHFADVRPRYRRSKIFSYFLPEIVEVLLLRPRDWNLFSLAMLAKYVKIRLIDLIPGGRKFLRSIRKWRNTQ